MRLRRWEVRVLLGGELCYRWPVWTELHGRAWIRLLLPVVRHCSANRRGPGVTLLVGRRWSS